MTSALPVRMVALMATGITHIFQKRTVSLREYLTRCIALCVHDRMADNDRLDHLQEDPSYRNGVREAEAGLAAAEALTLEEAAEMVDASTKRTKEWVEDYAQRRAALRKRYEATLTQLKEWKPDPLAEPFKALAIRHLEESMNYDCDGINLDESEPWTPEQYRQDQIDTARRILAARKEELANHLRHVRETNIVLDEIGKTSSTAP